MALHILGGKKGLGQKAQLLKFIPQGHGPRAPLLKKRCALSAPIFWLTGRFFSSDDWDILKEV
jgi:hypothetical protein